MANFIIFFFLIIIEVIYYCQHDYLFPILLTVTIIAAISTILLFFILFLFQVSFLNISVCLYFITNVDAYNWSYVCNKFM